LFVCVGLIPANPHQHNKILACDRPVPDLPPPGFPSLAARKVSIIAENGLKSGQKQLRMCQEPTMINVSAIQMQQFGVRFYQASLTAKDIDKLVRFEVLSYGEQHHPPVRGRRGGSAVTKVN
jgi:hypothetical protein